MGIEATQATLSRALRELNIENTSGKWRKSEEGESLRELEKMFEYCGGSAKWPRLYSKVDVVILQTKIFSAVIAALLLVSSPDAMSSTYAYSTRGDARVTQGETKKTKPKPQYPYRLENWNFRNMTVLYRSNGSKKTLYLEQLDDGGIRLNDTVNDGTIFVVPRGYIAHCNPVKHESLDKSCTEDLNEDGNSFIIFRSGTKVKCNMSLTVHVAEYIFVQGI